MAVMVLHCLAFVRRLTRASTRDRCLEVDSDAIVSGDWQPWENNSYAASSASHLSDCCY